jgi:hypothetical protein
VSVILVDPLVNVRLLLSCNKKENDIRAGVIKPRVTLTSRPPLVELRYLPARSMSFAAFSTAKTEKANASKQNLFHTPDSVEENTPNNLENDRQLTSDGGLLPGLIRLF